MSVRLARFVRQEELGRQRLALVETAWGYVGLVCRGDFVLRLVLPMRSRESVSKIIRSEWGAIMRDDELLPDLQGALKKYFVGEAAVFHCRVDISRVSDFAAAVLGECCRIKTGQTASYGQLARSVNGPGAARAVGAVMKSNRIPLIIPCHRVIAANDGLGGFSAPGGLAFKKRLLKHEKEMNLS